MSGDRPARRPPRRRGGRGDANRPGGGADRRGGSYRDDRVRGRSDDRGRNGRSRGPGRFDRQPGRGPQRGGPRRPPIDPQTGLPRTEKVVLPSDPREAALRVLHAVDTRRAFSDRLLEGAIAPGGDDRDRALLHELVKGSLRWRGRLDHALDPLVHAGFDKLQPWIRNVLRLGAYQLLFLDRVPAHAAVDESVKLAHKYGHPGSAGLVNSVLRRLTDEAERAPVPEGDDVDSLAVWGSHPRWIVERWLDRFGVEATRALLMADNRPVRTALRVNRLRATREQLIERLAGEGATAVPAANAPDVVWLETPHPPASLGAFRDGWCTAQDESEALVSRLVAPEIHERVLDLCAAPGGKCTHLAELMDDEGEVWGMEQSPDRIASLEATVKRLGTQAVHAALGDGRRYTFPMPFDRVLVDAPCSGLGVLARRADARWRKDPQLLREMPPVQLELLAAGGRRVRPGGVLVYSVCSFEPEETTGVVERFLRQSDSFVLESAAGALPEAVVDANGFMTTLPHVHGCDGAFAARFRRT